MAVGPRKWCAEEENFEMAERAQAAASELAAWLGANVSHGSFYLLSWAQQAGFDRIIQHWEEIAAEEISFESLERGVTSAAVNCMDNVALVEELYTCLSRYKAARGSKSQSHSGEHHSNILCTCCSRTLTVAPAAEQIPPGFKHLCSPQGSCLSVTI